MRSSWLLYFQLSFPNELSFKSCPSLASKSQSSLGLLSTFRFSLRISLEKLSFSLSFLLHGSVVTSAPSLSWVIPPTQTLSPLSQRTDWSTHFCPRPQPLPALVRHGVVWDHSKFNLLHLHLTPKSCKYRPFACYF